MSGYHPIVLLRSAQRRARSTREREKKRGEGTEGCGGSSRKCASLRRIIVYFRPSEGESEGTVRISCKNKTRVRAYPPRERVCESRSHKRCSLHTDGIIDGNQESEDEILLFIFSDWFIHRRVVCAIVASFIKDFSQAT